ncbi:shikimate kinase [Jatrophihabitans sp. YIM 134969]
MTTVLVGMPGAGKTTVGRTLAARLGLPFADSDDLVVAATGRSVTDLFAESEAVFRAAEATAIVDALASFDGVLALGGGSLLTASVREALAAGGVPVVLLRARVDTLAGRVGDATTRPLLVADPVARLEALDAERAALYLDAADVVVDTDDRSVADIVDLVQQATIGVRS